MGVLMKYLLILLLTGCQTAPPDLVGNWSGKVGPFKSSFTLKADGSGTFCYSGRKKNKTEWIKYSSGIIYTERDTEIVIESLSGNILTVEVDNYGSKEYVFYRDKHLKKASWFCWKKLSVK